MKRTKALVKRELEQATRTMESRQDDFEKALRKSGCSRFATSYPPGVAEYSRFYQESVKTFQRLSREYDILAGFLK